MQVCGERRLYRKELSASPNQLQHVYQRSATSHFIRTQPRPSPSRSLRLPHRIPLKKRGSALTHCTWPEWSHANPRALAVIEVPRAPSRPASAIVHKARFPYTLMQVCGERRRYRNGLTASPNQLQHVYQRSATSHSKRTQSRPGPNRSLRLPHPSVKKRTRTHILYSTSMEPHQAVGVGRDQGSPEAMPTVVGNCTQGSFAVYVDAGVR